MTSPPVTQPPRLVHSLVHSLVHIGVLASLVACFALPVIAWAAPGTTWALAAAALCAIFAPGAGIAALAVGHNRALWAATTPAVSLSMVMLVSLAQVLLDIWSPATGATILAMIGAAASTHWLRGHWEPHLLRTSAASLRRALDTTAIATLAAVAEGLLLWWRATQTIELDHAGASGLIAVLPWTWFTALTLLVATFGVVLTRGHRHGLLFLTTVAIAAVITLTVTVADGAATFPTGYIHVGFAETISQRGSLLEGYDARFSWPSFFTAVAAITAWSGARDASMLALIHPLAMIACYLPALVVIGRSITGSARVGWLAALLFIFANWGQQDYFSPQSTALLLYLAVLAVLLHEMSITVRTPRTPGVKGVFSRLATIPPAPDGWGTGRVMRAEALLLLLATALVTQHQLTPVALIAVLAGWSLVGYTRHHTLWFAVGVIFAAWFAFGADDWWTGHLRTLIEDIGRPDRALSRGVTNRLAGNATYETMQHLRIVWSGLLALVAVIGWMRLRTPRGTAARPMMLAATIPIIAPMSMALAQSYGGEMVLRIYLYASPILAVLAAHALRGLMNTRLAAVALSVLLVICGVSGITARGVNVAFERTPADVLEAARHVLAVAPAGSTIRPLAVEGTLRVDRVNEVYHPSSENFDPDASDYVNLWRQRPDYVFLTSTREAYERIVHGAADGYFDDVARRLEATGHYRVLLRSQHVIVLERLSANKAPISEHPGLSPAQPAPAPQPAPGPQPAPADGGQGR